MQKYFTTYFILLIFFMCLEAWGQTSGATTLEVENQSQSYNLNDHISVYVTNKSLSYSEAYNQIVQGSLRKIEATTNPGMNTDSTSYWIFFSVKNNLNDKDLIIKLDYPQMDYLSLFKIKKDSIEIKYITGDRYPFSQRPVINRAFILPIAVEPGKTESFLLNVDKKNSVIRFPLTLFHESYFAKDSINETIYYGAYFGVLIILIVLSVLVGIRLKLPVFGWYAFYLLAFGLWLFTRAGYTYEFFTGNHPQLNTHVLPAMTTLAVISITVYVQAFFNTKVLLPRFNKVINGIVAFFLSGYIFWALFPETFIEVAPALFAIRYILTLTVVVFAFTAAWIARKEHAFKAYMFLFAYTTFYVGIIMSILAEYGVINNPGFIYDPIMIGFMVEVVVLSYAMVTMVTKIVEEKDSLHSSNTDLKSSIENYKVKSEANLSEYLVLKSKAVIPYSKILYIKSDDHYLEFYLQNNKKEIDRNTLSSVLFELPDHFVRTHRSYIVNVNHIKIMYSNKILMVDESEIPLTRKYKKDISPILST